MTAVHCPTVISVLISCTKNSPFPRVACGIVSAAPCPLNAQGCGANDNIIDMCWVEERCWQSTFAVLSKQVAIAGFITTAETNWSEHVQQQWTWWSEISSRNFHGKSLCSRVSFTSGVNRGTPLLLGSVDP